MRYKNQAMHIYHSQRQRCYNPSAVSYPRYGAKGVRVEYTAAEFKLWWNKNIKRFRGIKVNVGRIDHSKNYSLDNIEMVTATENARERIERCGLINPERPVEQVEYKTKNPIASFKSLIEAERATGVKSQNIARMCRGRSSGKVLGFTFQYVGGA